MDKQGKNRIKIDLNQFKLHIRVRDRMEFSLHFNSPSRQFYLAIIALIAHEMKKLEKITSIPLEEHYETVALLNETIGGQAGSSSKEQLLPRVYRKWKDALPDLDHAPLFRVLGHTKEYEDTVGKTYLFTDEEKDAWANLFEYKGSHEHVRLRFSVDRLGVTLDEVVIIYGDDPELGDAEAWGSFLEGLSKEMGEKQERAPQISEAPAAPVLFLARWKRARLRSGRWPISVIAIGFAVTVASFLMWKSFVYSPKGEVSPFDREGYPLPDKPSIAVLPFINMSGDSKQEYLSDGITEQIITGLSKVPKLFVIARHSTFTYKGKDAKIQQVGRELGVRYVMEGSVHRSDSRIRITAQLIDAITGHHLWAERYDRELRDIFAIQDEITLEIIKAMQVELTMGETARVTGRGTKNLDAYLRALHAQEEWLRLDKEGSMKARQLATHAIALDPEYGYAYAILAWCHMFDVVRYYSASPEESMRLAVETIQKALALDPSDHRIHRILSNLYVLQGNHDEAIASSKRALELCPGGAGAHENLGIALLFACRPLEAISMFEKAIQLDPFPPAVCHRDLARAYSHAGRYEDAVEQGEKAFQSNPNDLEVPFNLAIAYAKLDRIDKARAAAAEVLRINPEFSLDSMAKMRARMFAKRCHPDRVYGDIEFLRKADIGLK